MMSFDEESVCSSTAPMKRPQRRLSNEFRDNDNMEDFSMAIKDENSFSKNSKIGRSSSICTASTAAETDCSDDERDCRRVRFAMTVKRYFVESHKSFTDEERTSSWYSQKEIAKTTRTAQKLAARLECGKLEKRSSPYRGLQCWTKAGAAELEDKIFRTNNAVMDEQERQWTHDLVDSFQMATISLSVTFPSIKKALDIAFEDEISAAAIYAAGPIDIFADDDSTVGSAASFGSSNSKKKKRKSSSNKNRRAVRKGRRKSVDHEDPSPVEKKKKTSSKKSSSSTTKKRTSKAKKQEE